MIFFRYYPSGFTIESWSYSIHIDSDKILKQRIELRSHKLKGNTYKDYEMELSNTQYLKLYELIRNINFKAAVELDSLIQMCDTGSYELRVKIKDEDEKILELGGNYPYLTESLVADEQKKQFLAKNELSEDFNLDGSIATCKAFNIFLDYINNLLPIEDSLATTRKFFRSKPEKFWITCIVKSEKDISKIYLKLKKILRPYGLEYTVEKQRAEGKIFWDIGEVTSIVADCISQKCKEADISIQISELD